MNMTTRMDDKDKTIISMYSADSDVSQDAIAKVIRLSQPSVAARVARLKASGALEASVGINPLKMGLYLAKVDLASTRPNEIIDMFLGCPYFANGFSVSGRHNLSLFFFSEAKGELARKLVHVAMGGFAFAVNTAGLTTFAGVVGPTVVSVTTGGYENGSWHFEPAMEALAAGRHVLCEKPLSNDIGEAREMVRCAAERRLYLGCNLNHYFTPTAERATEYMKAGQVGELVYCLHKVGFNGSEAAYQPNTNWRWWGFPYAHMKAFLTHPFSVMRYFCGDITHVQAFVDRPGFRRAAGDIPTTLQLGRGPPAPLHGHHGVDDDLFDRQQGWRGR